MQAVMNTDTALLVELISQQGAKYDLAQARQAEAQARQAEAQARQAEAQARFEAAQIKRDAYHLEALKKVESRLGMIESHVIVIKDRVLSDFANSTVSTKDGIEGALTVADDNTTGMALYTEVLDIEDFHHAEDLAYKLDLNHPPKTRRKRNSQKGFIKPATLFAQLIGNPTQGQLSAFGNWMSAIISKFMGRQVYGKYPPFLHDAIEILTLYYVFERSSVRMY